VLWVCVLRRVARFNAADRVQRGACGCNAPGQPSARADTGIVAKQEPGQSSIVFSPTLCLWAFVTPLWPESLFTERNQHPAQDAGFVQRMRRLKSRRRHSPHLFGWLRMAITRQKNRIERMRLKVTQSSLEGMGIWSDSV